LSGGKFDYVQFRLPEVYETIQDYIDKNGKELTEQEMDELKKGWYDPEWFEKYPDEKYHEKFTDETIERFREAVRIVKLAEIYIQRVDWFLSSDDGEESFHRRLKEDLDKL